MNTAFNFAEVQWQASDQYFKSLRNLWFPRQRRGVIMSIALHILSTTFFHVPGRTVRHQHPSMPPIAPAPSTAPASDLWNCAPWAGLYEASTA